MFEDWHSQSHSFFIWKYLILSEEFFFLFVPFFLFSRTYQLRYLPGQMFGAYIVILKIKIYFNNFFKC